MAVRLPARNWLQVARACAVRDVRSALTERSTLIQTISLPVNYMIMMILFVLAGSHAPAAVVMHDNGPYAQQLVTALRQAHAYNLTIESEAQAQDQWRQGTLVALFTIPANFDTAVAHGQAVQIPLAINNLNEDLTHDAEWAARQAITAFYARAFPHQVSIFPQEHDQYAQDAGYVQFLAMSVIVIALMVSGLLQAGTAAARDWEEGTIQELLLAPGRPSAVLAGRMAGAFAVSLPAAVIVIAAVIFIVGDHPAHLAVAAGISLLTLATFVAAGTALGTALKDRSAFVVLTRAIPVPLFFLSGVFGAIGFQTAAVRSLASVLPIHYAIVLEQYAFGGFRTGTLTLGTDALIVAGFLLAFAVLAAVTMQLSRRGAAASQT